MSKATREIILGRFEHLVLLAITIQGENAYGTTIRQAIEGAEEREIAIGALYVTLDRMEQKGLVTSILGEPTAARGGRAKKYFHLTREGQLALDRAQRTQQRLTATLGYKEQ